MTEITHKEENALKRIRFFYYSQLFLFFGYLPITFIMFWIFGNSSLTGIIIIFWYFLLVVGIFVIGLVKCPRCGMNYYSGFAKTFINKVICKKTIGCANCGLHLPSPNKRKL